MKTSLLPIGLVLLFQTFAYGQTATSTTLSASPNPSNYGQPVTLTAAVTSGATGKVTFYDGVTILGVGTISGRQASISTVMLASGTRSLRAYYQGNGTFAASGSTWVAQTVVAGPSLGFRPPLNIPSAHQSYAAAVGDFNGDSRQDLAMVSRTDNCVTIYLSNGDGTFQSGVDYAVGTSPDSVAVGDFNGDGRMDLAVSSYNGGNNISILLGNGDGTFPQAVSYQFQYVPLTVAIADFNGDGSADLMSLTGYGDVAVLLGKGDGTFQNASYYPALGNLTYTSALAIADFNGDGKPDVAVTTPEQLEILLGNGDGTFQAAQNISGTSGGSGVIATDLNGDGRADLLVYGGDLETYVLLGNGDGTFVVTGFGTFAPPPQEAAPAVELIEDFNGDGKPDLALLFYLCCTPVSNNVLLLPGNGDGTFGSPVSYHLNTGFNFGVVGDFDGDGAADFVLGSYGNTGFSVLLGGALPDLTVAASHGIGFTQGQQSATYGITVTNSGDYASSGAAGVVTSLAQGLTANTIGGNGWTCVLSSLACTRNDSLSVGASYPAIILQVSMASGLTGTVTSTFTVSGGGESKVSNDIFTDTTFMRYPTTTTLTVSPNPSALSQAITLTAVVTAGATGHVDFYDGVSPIGSAAVSSGQSTLTTSSLLSGSRSLRAAYSGDSSYGPSSSAIRTQAVNPVTANGAQPFTSYPVDIAPAWIVAADLKGEGKTDLITVNGSSDTGGTISVLLNAGNGTFRAAVNYSIGNGLFPNAAVVGDFNNDGKPDVVAAGSNGISFLPANGDGTFQTAQAYPASTSFNTLATADFNGDGNLDLVTLSSGTIVLFLGNGDGTFQLPVTLTALGGPYNSLRVADMNGDGKSDIVSLNTSTLQVSVFLGNGDGTFMSPKTESAVTNGVNVFGEFAVGDYNGDGKLDVAVICGGAVEFLKGNGDGSLAAPVPSLVSAQTGGSAIAADLNGDGKLDIAFSAGTFNDTVSFVFGGADGTFQSGPSFVTGFFNNPGVTSIAVGDFNGDGRLDFAVTSNELGTVGVFLTGQFPSITLSSTHNGRFTAGGTGTYQIAVADPAFAQITGIVTVTDTLPAGLSATGIGGDGWNCTLASLTCTRADGLNGGASYPAIAVIVNVRADLTPSVINNQVALTNAGARISATDPTTIVVPSTTSLAVTPNPSNLSQPVALTATVPPGVTGTVLFLENEVAIGTAPIVNGQATLTTSLLPAGLLNLTATYAGDSRHAPSSSSATQHTVSASPASAFSTPALYATGTGPVAIAAGDFNNDGNTDLVTANQSGNTVSVMLGLGDGTFAPKSDYAAGTRPSSVAVADFNNDGQPDIAVSNTGSNNVSILLGNPDGTFQAAVNSPTGGSPSYLTVTDVNNDGKVDLVALVGPYPTILFGNGDGTFQPAVMVNQGASSFAVGDFNADGKVDLFTNYGLLLGEGNGMFEDTLWNGVLLQSIAAGDLRGVGKLDAVGVFIYGTYIYLGDGDGTVTGPTIYSATFSPGNVSLADINGDGKLDAVGVGEYINGVTILLGNGDGTMQSPTSVAAGGYAQAIIAADFNGDGRTDLAVVNSSASSVTVLLGSLTPILSVTSSHGDPFALGQTGATYAITVTNNGPGATSEAVTVTDLVPSGLTVTAIAGTGWNCTLSSLTCTISSVLLPGQSYPPIMLTMNVTRTAVGSGANQVTVSGGGAPTVSAFDPTLVIGPAIAIQTSPAGRQFTVDGGPAQTAPQTLNLAPGPHTIAVAATQAGTPGTQYVFTTWSDSGAASHIVSVGSLAATYTAISKRNTC